MCFKFIGLIVLSTLPALASSYEFTIGEGVQKGAWLKLLQSVQWSEHKAGHGPAALTIIGADAPLPRAEDRANSILVIEGTGSAARNLGFKVEGSPVSVRQIRDTHAPDLPVIWEKETSIPLVSVPADFQLFAAEKWKKAPVLAGKRIGQGAVLWMATSPGNEGFERYPYLLQALSDLGMQCPLRTANLWAFFDSSYRIRADPDYLASRWRQAGISALHVAAWHNMEPEAQGDKYLSDLVEACHRHSILVYAWLELPHVSETFWAEHPEWRERTAVGQDAQLDWRKLMNLQNPECHQAVLRQLRTLLARFDWDGVNLAELYFESLEGASNPARFTPMNDDVRREFKAIASFDPKLLFDPASSFSAQRNPQALRKFLDYRSGLAARMQSEWLNDLESVRPAKPYLDFVLTHIDDRFDPGIRDLLGADVKRSLPVLQAHHATLLVEDPATLWSLGPDRYAKLAAKYAEIAPGTTDKKLAVDLNIVDRYQDVYPTKKQTGGELLELVHQAAKGFGTVAVYIENSISKQDLPLLPAAAARASFESSGPDEAQVNANEGTRVSWQGSVELDGKPWPVQDRSSVFVPAGKHRLTPGFSEVPVRIVDFNGNIRSATIEKDRVNISYDSRTRALARLGTPVSAVEVDGAIYWKAGHAGSTDTSPLLLPAGQHLLTLVK